MPYYHLTTQFAKNRILTNGLLPKIGVRSRQTGETQTAVHLCDETSLPYWRAILRLPVLFQIDERALNNHHAILNYGLYSEYIAYDPIPPEALTPITNDTFGQPTKEQRKLIHQLPLFAFRYIGLPVLSLRTPPNGRTKTKLQTDNPGTALR